MSIRLKLLCLLGGATLIVLAGLSALHDVQQRQLAGSAANVVRLHLEMAERIVKLKSEPLLGMANDYTFWDEMVAFAAKPEPKWAAQNLDTALETFAIDRAWVLRPDAKVIYATTRDDAALRPALPLALPQILPRIDKEKLPHFYVATVDGLFELVAASIHPTRDQSRLTAPAGYLLIARRWDADYLQQLSTLVDAKLQLTDAAAAAAATAPAPATDGLIEAFIPLSGASGTPIAWLKLSAQSNYLQELQTGYRTTFTSVVAVSLLLLLATSLALRQFVNRPLRQLTRAPRTNRSQPWTGCRMPPTNSAAWHS